MITNIYLKDLYISFFFITQCLYISKAYETPGMFSTLMHHCAYQTGFFLKFWNCGCYNAFYIIYNFDPSTVLIQGLIVSRVKTKIFNDRLN